MFANRLIKALHLDVMVLTGQWKEKSDGMGPFLFAHEDATNPYIKVGGNQISAAEIFLGCLTTKDTIPPRKGANTLAEVFGMSHECQFFDFGRVANEQIKEESLTVAEGYEVGLIDLPAPVCWFEHQWSCDEIGAVASGYIFIKIKDGIMGAEIRLLSREQVPFHGFTVRDKIHHYGEVLQAHSEYFIWDGVMVHLPEGASHLGYECGVPINVSGNDPNPSNVFDPLMSMLGRLNADGIDKVRVPAPAKLNRRRASKGLPGAVAYTEVKIRPYRAPMGHSGPLQGERAAVRYHFRRGHVRHFQNGGVTWVRPCFVGDPGDGIVKHTYKDEAPHAR